MVEQFASGESDLLTIIPSDYFEPLRSNHRVSLIKYGGLNSMFLGFQMNRPALKDRRVREALVRGVNRDRLTLVLGRGALITAKSVLPPNCPGFDSELTQAPYDPERARVLLKDAGMQDYRFRLLYFSPFELWTEVAHTVQTDLERLGVGVDLIRVGSWAEFHEERKKGHHDLFLYNWTISAPDAERFLYPLFFSQSEYNFGQFANTRVDALLTQSRQPIDQKARVQLHAEANRLIVQEMPALFLVHRVGIAGYSNRVKGLQLNIEGFPQDKLATVEIR
jgi:dipeptide transport system substrate-binding protein